MTPNQLTDALAAAEELESVTHECWHHFTHQIETVLTAFRELARAEYIQMRRGWGTQQNDNDPENKTWIVRGIEYWELRAREGMPLENSTPRAALIAADDWLKEQEKGKSP